MIHLDLFSGIGGFSLAVDNVFHEQENKHIFVEWDDFCQEVLKKHWPEAEIHSDIDKFIADTKRKRLEGTKSDKKLQPEGSLRYCSKPFILTGGFPCQPFSQAGRRQGTSDDRYKWPSMLECISLFRPEWVIAENVGGLVTWNNGMVLETVCSDLEKEGYEVQPFVIPACAVGAPHRRDRVWIVANKLNARLQGGEQAEGTGHTGQRGGDGKDEAQDFNAQDSISKRSGGGMESSGQVLERKSSKIKNERPDWSKHWFEVATRLCRVDDGIPRRLDRNSRLKALGNAIVPQVAEQILKAIKSLTPPGK